MRCRSLNSRSIGSEALGRQLQDSMQMLRMAVGPHHQAYAPQAHGWRQGAPQMRKFMTTWV